MKSVMLAAALAVAAAVFVASSTAHSATSPMRLVRVTAADPERRAATLRAEGFDVVEGGVRNHSVDLVLDAADLRRLAAKGMSFDTVDLGGPLRQRPKVFADSLPPESGYARYESIVAELQRVASGFPAIAALVDVTAFTGAPATFEGRHIFALRISDNVAVREDEPAVLIVAAHHAREIGTPIAALEAIHRLTANYDSDPAIKQIVDSNEIWIAPVWNPDGYEYVFTSERFWRKNRRPLEAAVGVDLNRNYAFDWNGACPGTFDQGDDQYRGPSEASEAETQTMALLADRVRFAKVLDHHSYGRWVAYGYACLSHPFRDFWESEARTLAFAAGYDGAQMPPPSHGMHHQFQTAKYGAHAFAIESSLEFQPPYAESVKEAIALWNANRWILERPISVMGHVRDAATSRPLRAAIVVVGAPVSNGETRESADPFGRFDMVLPPGTHVLAFSAPGRRTEERTVTVALDSTETIEVQLSALSNVSMDGYDGAAADAPLVSDTNPEVSMDSAGEAAPPMDTMTTVPAGNTSDAGGCSCRILGRPSNQLAGGWLALVITMLALSRTLMRT